MSTRNLLFQCRFLRLLTHSRSEEAPTGRFRETRSFYDCPRFLHTASSQTNKGDPMSLLLLRPGESYPVTELVPLVDKLLTAIENESARHALLLAKLRPGADGQLVAGDHPLAPEINSVISLGGYDSSPPRRFEKQSPWLAMEVVDGLQVVSRRLGFEDPEIGRDVAKVLAELSVPHQDYNITTLALSSLASRVCSMGIYSQRTDFLSLGFGLEAVAIGTDLMKMKLAKRQWGAGTARDMCRIITSELLTVPKRTCAVSQPSPKKTGR